GVLRLPLGADEQDASTLSNGVADGLQRAVHHRHRLRQIDNVDVVAGAEDVLGHLRIPTMGLMAEVHAGFQKLAHAEVWQRHDQNSPVDPPRTESPPRMGQTPDGCLRPRSACEVGALYRYRPGRSNRNVQSRGATVNWPRQWLGRGPPPRAANDKAARPEPGRPHH